MNKSTEHQNVSHSRLLHIRTRLQQSLNPTLLEVIDESAQHRGHAGAQSGAGHFRVIISSDAFRGKALIDCHRLVYQALDDMMTTDIHALSIDVRS